MKYIFLTSLAILFLISSCRSPKLAADYKSERPSIKSLGIIKPYSYLKKYHSKKEIIYDSLLSGVAIKNMEQEFPTAFAPAGLKVSSVYTNDTLLKELIKIVSIASKSKTVSKISVPSYTKSFLTKNNVDVGVFAFQSGFSRTSKNYTTQMLKSIGIGILTLGLYIPVPIKANSILYLLMVNAKKGNVLYFHKISVSGEPDKKRISDREIKTAIKPFLNFK